ncbi:MAG: hypothetical protein PHD76_10655 [Methylacidiphilales bacterium]|nr:hypothetical protein [Candidatus Methylacidiphilales bacterium]
MVSVFPHPFLSQRVIAATRTGLFFSDDAGLTWKALPEASAEKVGVIQKVEFHPTEIGAFYLASQSRGVWITNDNGKTFTQVGTKANGMAADSTVDLIIYPADTAHKTVLAVHGAAGAGISRSRDGGRTWDVLDAGYFFRRLLAPERYSMKVYLTGSSKEEPDVQNLYGCNSLGEPVIEVMHDALFTDMAFALGRQDNLYIATSDSGLYRIDMAEFTPEIKLLGSKETGWASVAATWGPNADVLSLCLYNTSKLGLVFSTDELSTNRAINGLPVGAFVKEGASVRPNANGTIFYAAINESLLIGRPDETVPVVNITPAAFQPLKDTRKISDDLRLAFEEFERSKNNTAKAASDLCLRFGDLAAPYRSNQMTITARLPLKPAPPLSVTADLSRFGGSSASPLFDDGKHEDGAAGDGVYGFSFYYQPMSHQEKQDDWRPSWPGRLAIGVTASYAGGTRQGAVGVVGLYPEVQSWVFWGYYHDKIAVKAEGDITTESVPNPNELHKGPTGALRIHAGHGPWSISIDIPPWSGGDITGYEALSFGVRSADGPPPKELYVQLRDAPELSEATTTDRIGVIHEGVREGAISSEYRTVVVPFDKLLGKQIAQFQTSRLSKIIISGDGGDPVNLFIDWLSYLPHGMGLNSADKAQSK